MPRDVKIEFKTGWADKELKLMAKGLNNAMGQTKKQRTWAANKTHMFDFVFYIDREDIGEGLYRYSLNEGGTPICKCNDRLELLEKIQEMMDEWYGEEIY